MIIPPLTSPKPSAFKGYIGVSQKDITPPVGIFAKNWGAATHEKATGIHRPMFLVCNTFQIARDAQPLVLIGADLGWWKNAAHEQLFRKQILEATGLPAGNLMFCLSHTHAGPGICLDDETKPGGELIRPYFDQLIESSIAAIKEALSVSQPATLTWQYGECNLAVNRDFPDPVAERILTGYHPGVPSDNTLLVGRISNEKGEVMGTLVNYACHPTTLAWQNKLISPDYIGAMRQLVETGTKAPCLFLQGASGELSPPQQFTGSTQLADRYGRQLGYAVCSTLEAMEAAGQRLAYQGVVESGASLAMWEAEEIETSTVLQTEMVVVTFPLKDFPKYATLEAEWKDCSEPVLKERLWRKMCIRMAIGDGDSTEIPLWIWQLGNSILIGQPNEPYSEFQIEIRAQHPETAIAVMNLVNGSYGYLPPEELYLKNAYPVWQTPFASGSLNLLKEITAQTVNRLLEP